MGENLFACYGMKIDGKTMTDAGIMRLNNIILIILDLLVVLDILLKLFGKEVEKLGSDMPKLEMDIIMVLQTIILLVII